MRQVSSLNADQLELTSACLSSFSVMKPLWSVSTVWNHWKASGLTPGGTLPGQEKGGGGKRTVSGSCVVVGLGRDFLRLEALDFRLQGHFRT